MVNKRVPERAEHRGAAAACKAGVSCHADALVQHDHVIQVVNNLNHAHKALAHGVLLVRGVYGASLEQPVVHAHHALPLPVV